MINVTVTKYVHELETDTMRFFVGLIPSGQDLVQVESRLTMIRQGLLYCEYMLYLIYFNGN